MNAIVLVAGGPQAGPSSGLMERLLGENSALTERVAALNQERASLRHALAALERRLRRAENDLAQVTAAETENRPVGTIGDAVSHGKVRPETLSVSELEIISPCTSISFSSRVSVDSKIHHEPMPLLSPPLRCSVCTSGTCAPRASGSRWCTRSAT